MATLFSSHYPSQHGVLTHPLELTDARIRVERLSAEFTTLAEVLRDAGYRTAAFVANPWLRKGLGFEQGFELYDDSFAAWDAPGKDVSRAALEWLGQVQSEQPFFLYLHYMDSHRPYPPLSRWEILEAASRILGDGRPLVGRAAEEIPDVVQLAEGVPASEAGLAPSVALVELAYDRGIESFDRALGLFLDGFSSHEANAETAIIVTSDHGEALYERGYGNHGAGLYDDELGIPLAARLPGVSATGSRIECAVGLVDIFPTLCTYLDIACPETVFGLSQLEPATEADARYLVSEGVAGQPENRAIRNGVHKLLWQPGSGPDGAGHLLFDYRDDPGESRDLLAATPRAAHVGEIYEALARALEEAVPAVAVPDAETKQLDPAEVERLRSLGYVD
jgi:arylsulfatase A-like enzyme